MISYCKINLSCLFEVILPNESKKILDFTKHLLLIMFKRLYLNIMMIEILSKETMFILIKYNKYI